ncbi:U32 family peptidase C-terminal domain-containing protein [Thermoproteota archaeon]
MEKPELLAPAGNFEKLKTAFAFGADAVYIGIRGIGLRKFSENISFQELEQAVHLANQTRKRIYITLNAFAFNNDLHPLTDTLVKLESIKPHALIISDMGVLQLAKKLTTLPIHISTQASVVNQYGCDFYEQAGAKRIILARELSLKDIRIIRKHTDIELEVFVHGAMCAGYSGKCVISNYLSHRDANRGGCVQNCRHEFRLNSLYPHSESPSRLQTQQKAFLMNTKDLNTLPILNQIINTGVNSLKIEGRMKSHLYIATAVLAYRQAIDNIIANSKSNHTDSHSVKNKTASLLNHVSNRTFCTGGFEKRPGARSMRFSQGGYKRGVSFIGIIKSVTPNTALYAEIKNPFQTRDTLKIICQDGVIRELYISNITSMCGTEIDKTTPNSFVKLPFLKDVSEHDILYKTTESM